MERKYLLETGLRYNTPPVTQFQFFAVMFLTISYTRTSA